MSNLPVKKIFIVDDDENIHDIINLIFEQDGYLIKGVLNADNLTGDVGGFLPDIILLDIRVGKHDGRELCNRLKENPETAHLPIILLSAMNMDDLGCFPDERIEKPFDIVYLREKVIALLNQA